MQKKQKMIPLTQLNLTNRFLFDEVVDDPQTHQDILAIILGDDVPPLKQNSTEKEHRISPLAHSVRMDVFAIDEQDTVYNTEMQAKERDDLQKRSRYYQSLMDTSLLEPGAADYNQLNDSYIIMILTFDLFGDGNYKYTFLPQCQESPNTILQDGATRIFLNTKGYNKENVSQELIDFLHYIENSTEETAAAINSKRIQRIHERVCRVRTNEQVGVRYMQAWEERIYDRQEAREDGREMGRKEQDFIKTITLVKKNMARGLSLKDIADFLDEDVSEVQKIADLIQQHPEADVDSLYETLVPEADRSFEW